MSEDTMDMTRDEMLRHLSKITEPYGLSYHFELEGDTIVSLMITATDNPEVNTAIDAAVMAVGLLCQAAHETICLFSRDRPLLERHQSMHMLHQLIGEQAAQAMTAAVDRTKTEIEIVH